MVAKKVYVVDNGGQWTHRIWRVVRDLGCEAKIIANTTPVEEIDADSLILSGGAPRVAWDSPKLGNCRDYIRNFSGPLLGICVGHQLLAMHYGGEAGPARVPEYGITKVRVLAEDDLFKGLPASFSVWESHNDEVKSVKDFIVLAESENCKIQAIKHKTKVQYGVQFHPEVTHTEHGTQILKNFINI